MFLQKLLSLLVQRKRKGKKNTQKHNPHFQTHRFSFTLSSPCHLSSTLSVQCISSWCAKGTANTPGECFFRRIEGNFRLSLSPRRVWVKRHCPRSPKAIGQNFLSSQAIRKLLNWDRTASTLGKEKTKEGVGRRANGTVEMQQNQPDSSKLDWLVADLISCDVPSSLHLMFSAPSTQRSSTRADVAMLLRSASKQSARIEKHWPVTEACTCNLLPVSCNFVPLDNA